MEESTILLSVGSSIVEPQYPKVHKTAKTDKVFSQMLDSIGHVQARAMGVVPQARVFQQVCLYGLGFAFVDACVAV